MASVRFDSVTKAFGRGASVLRDVVLEIRDGSFVTLVGPSGCGKSTMLNLVAGFEQPTLGNVVIDDEVVNDRSPRDRGAAMVFQSYALYPHLDVRRNIAFPLEVAGVAPPEIERRVREIAGRLDIANLLSRRPRELSGGQRQRVALARALVRHTKLCLFDEPLSNLDAGARTVMRAEIKKLHEEGEATYIYVTHDQLEAMTMSDEIVVLRAGIIQQVAPPIEIYDRPVNMFVASFIGSPRINLVRPATLRLLERRRGVIAGIRPDDLTIGGGPMPESAIPGRVYVAEPVGAETWVTMDTDGERLIGRAPKGFVPRSGEIAWATYDPTRVLLFDQRSEMRVER